MKTLLFSLALILCFNAYAQDTSKAPFLRVRNLDGEKIAKGRLVQVTDSTLTLRKNKDTVEVVFRDIGVIKTKRSLGNNLLTGAAIGAGTFGLIGVTTSTDRGFLSHSPSQGLGAGILIGAPLGSAAGGIFGLFKNRKTYDINGNEEHWNAFKALFSNQ